MTSEKKEAQSENQGKSLLWELFLISVYQQFY